MPSFAHFLMGHVKYHKVGINYFVNCVRGKFLMFVDLFRRYSSHVQDMVVGQVMTAMAAIRTVTIVTEGKYIWYYMYTVQQYG